MYCKGTISIWGRLVYVDSDFDADWKEEVENKVSSFGNMSESYEDDLLDIAREKGEVVKKTKTGGSDSLVPRLSPRTIIRPLTH